MEAAGETLPALLLRQPEMFACPRCEGGLEASEDRIRCSGCGESFGCERGIPLLFWPHDGDAEDVTERIKAFYEEIPFPDYEDLDSSASLQAKARRGVFAGLLDEQVPDTARVLDAGCGTGQLTNFLALCPGRTVVGADLCLSSLKLAQAFKLDNRIDSATFLQMNLFRPALRPGSFDLVASNGVLHHTSAPERGLRSLARLVRPGGFLIVGLYNAFGRLPTDLRRLVFRLCGGRLQALDPRLRGPGLGEARKRSWFMDQYRNPHESRHTIGQVLRWFDSCGFDFVNSVPKATAFQPFAVGERLFEPAGRGSGLDQLLVQLGMLLKGGREGGLFIMIGQKRA